MCAAFSRSLPSLRHVFLHGLTAPARDLCFPLLALSTADAAPLSKSCSENMARLYEEFSRQKSVFSKYSPHVLADYIGVAQSHALPADVKAALLPGVYAGAFFFFGSNPVFLFGSERL